MSTIIYLYHGREDDKFVTEKWQESDYCLIRLGVPQLLWQGQETLKQADNHRKGRRRFFDRFRKTMEERKQKEAWARHRESLQKELVDLQKALTLLGDNPYRTYCVYEEALRGKLGTKLWQQYWKITEFDDYHERIWVDKLMPHTIPGHYLILGYATCLPEILCENARKMRSIKWWLKERQYTQEQQDFVENFYEEYGLAIEVHLLDEEESWLRVRPASTVPVNILDFSGEEKISACDVARGSIWLDMDSMEEKSKRIETRNPGIRYFSLKKQWEQRQKEAICLDTIHKNGYNT